MGDGIYFNKFDKRYMEMVSDCLYHPRFSLWHLYHHIHGLSNTNGAAAGGQVRVGLSSSFMNCIDGEVDRDHGSVVRRVDLSTQSLIVTLIVYPKVVLTHGGVNP